MSLHRSSASIIPAGEFMDRCKEGRSVSQCSSDLNAMKQTSNGCQFIEASGRRRQRRWKKNSLNSEATSDEPSMTEALGRAALALLQEAAQPTIENSPPLQRWDQIREGSRVRETDG